MNKKITAVIGSIIALLGAVGAFFAQVKDVIVPEEEVTQTMPSINISQQNVQKQETDVQTGDISIDEELEELLK